MVFCDQRVGNFVIGEFVQKLLHDIVLLELDILLDRLCAEGSFFILLDHLSQSLNLPLVFVPDIPIHLHLEIEALGEVDPVHPLAPGSCVSLFLKELIELLFSRFDVLLRGVNYKVVVLGEDGDKCGFFEFAGPGELVDEMEQLGLVHRISLGETGNVYDAM